MKVDIDYATVHPLKAQHKDVINILLTEIFFNFNKRIDNNFEIQRQFQ